MVAAVDEIRAITGDRPWIPVTLGMSGAKVYRIENGDKQYYLKASALDDVELKAEQARLEWLRGQLPVPRIVYFGADDHQRYLLTSAIPGVPASDEMFAADPEKLVRLLALGVQTIHNVRECPFDMSLDVKIAAARARIDAGKVAIDNFDPEREGVTAESLYQDLLNLCPASEDLVFTHGDYCLENVIIDVNPRLLYLRGFIDWGRAGVADRYQDLALAAREIEDKFDAEMVKIFFETYGEGFSPDDPRTGYYKLMDEFF